jgi:hypothetical protein
MSWLHTLKTPPNLDGDNGNGRKKSQKTSRYTSLASRLKARESFARSHTSLCLFAAITSAWLSVTFFDLH